MRIWKQVDGWSTASLENSERIDDWSIESRILHDGAEGNDGDVFDGRCAILEPMMRECGAWVRKAKHRQNPDCDRRTCGNTKTVKLDVETNDNIVDQEDVDELRHQQQHNVIDPQREKLVEEIVEIVQIISQKHL